MVCSLVLLIGLSCLQPDAPDTAWVTPAAAPAPFRGFPLHEMSAKETEETLDHYARGTGCGVHSMMRMEFVRECDLATGGRVKLHPATLDAVIRRHGGVSSRGAYLNILEVARGQQRRSLAPFLEKKLAGLIEQFTSGRDRANLEHDLQNVTRTLARIYVHASDVDAVLRLSKLPSDDARAGVLRAVADSPDVRIQARVKELCATKDAKGAFGRAIEETLRLQESLRAWESAASTSERLALLFEQLRGPRYLRGARGRWAFARAIELAHRDPKLTLRTVGPIAREKGSNARISLAGIAEFHITGARPARDAS